VDLLNIRHGKAIRFLSFDRAGAIETAGRSEYARPEENAEIVRRAGMPSTQETGPRPEYVSFAWSRRRRSRSR
jgi:hypothetical protein